jgi:hypothetical protein
MTREQIMRIFKDYSVTHGGLTELADAILALPIDVPGDKEIEKKANGIANPKSQREFERGEWMGVKEGARWMRDEIIKRNRP